MSESMWWFIDSTRMDITMQICITHHPNATLRSEQNLESGFDVQPNISFSGCSINIVQRDHSSDMANTMRCVTQRTQETCAEW
ncbi:hypothetical protein SCLCIDRAFT_1217114 [Scleroderma citrinum Foug A]|uniref:Uncharacterized protein n=1 Tax=Scleroderma citrinum Foug A TaxID=1036808 RepID=A0A0C3A5W6_9AGAM|nr:hypothetical protein SCLCIDRAFT_1217114 [Scleroderma citrinum Foug A]